MGNAPSKNDSANGTMTLVAGAGGAATMAGGDDGAGAPDDPSICGPKRISGGSSRMSVVQASTQSRPRTQNQNENQTKTQTNTKTPTKSEPGESAERKGSLSTRQQSNGRPLSESPSHHQGAVRGERLHESKALTLSDSDSGASTVTGTPTGTNTTTTAARQTGSLSPVTTRATVTAPAPAPVPTRAAGRLSPPGGAAAALHGSSPNSVASSAGSQRSVQSSATTVSTSSSRSSGERPRRASQQPGHRIPVGDYIKRLLSAGASSKPKSLPLTQDEIRGVASAAREVLLAQPVLLELGTPVKVVGDIHGQYGDLLRILRMCGMPPKANYLFLGDYVDRGRQSLETLLLLLCLKIRYPENVFLLRGNHESASVTRVYGFYDECKRRASVKIWRSLVDVFNVLPIAATIGGKIFCVHGGLSPALTSLDDVYDIQRPTDVPDAGLLSDLLWSDPDPSVHLWRDNDRGVSYCFGRQVLDRFCRKFRFDLVARGHMVVEDGYEFFGNRRLVTIFSAPNYCGDFGNWGAVMNVDRDLLCSFELLKPTDGAKKRAGASVRYAS